MKQDFIISIEHIFLDNKKMILKISAAFFMLAVLAALFYVFVYKKLYDSYNSNRSQIKQLQQDIESLRKFNEQFEEEKQKLINLLYEYNDIALVYHTDELEKLKLEIVRAQDIETLSKKLEMKIRAISEKHFEEELQDGRFVVHFARALNQQNVKLNSFVPSEIEDKGYLLMLPIEMEIEGSYPAVLEIITFLEKQAYLTQIDYLKIQLLEQEMEQEGYSVLNNLMTASGNVKAELSLSAVSLPTPSGKRFLEDIKNWNFGTDNPFEGVLIEIDLPQDTDENTNIENADNVKNETINHAESEGNKHSLEENNAAFLSYLPVEDVNFKESNKMEDDLLYLPIENAEERDILYINLE